MYNVLKLWDNMSYPQGGILLPISTETTIEVVEHITSPKRSPIVGAMNHHIYPQLVGVIYTRRIIHCLDCFCSPKPFRCCILRLYSGCWLPPVPGFLEYPSLKIMDQGCDSSGCKRIMSLADYTSRFDGFLRIRQLMNWASLHPIVAPDSREWPWKY